MVAEVGRSGFLQYYLDCVIPVEFPKWKQLVLDRLIRKETQWLRTPKVEVPPDFNQKDLQATMIDKQFVET